MFGILAAWKCDYTGVMIEDYITSGEQLFIILAAWKCNSCSVVKSFTSVLLAPCQALFDVLATWKCEISTVMRASNQKNLISLCCCRAFLWPKNTFLQVSWDPRLKVTWLPVGTCLNFGAWKSDSWRVVSQSDQVYMTSCQSRLLHFGGLKMRFRKCHEKYLAS